MMELTEFVSNQPLRDQGEELTCPWCSAPDVGVMERMTTLVGGPAEINHDTKYCICNACSGLFHVESKNGYRWITDEGNFVLAGMPACFEDYTLTHKDCGGDVKREYRNLDGTPLNGGLWTHCENGKPVKQYRVFWCCSTCEAQIETAEDHWYPSRPAFQP